MKKLLLISFIFILISISNGYDINNQGLEILTNKASDSFFESITMMPAFNSLNGKTYSSTTPTFKIKTTCPKEDYEEILVDVYLNGNILLDKSIPLGDFTWENWSDSIATFKMNKSKDWYYFLNTEKVNEIYFILKYKQLIETSDPIHFYLDGTKPVVKCYDEDGDWILGTDSSNSHEVDIFAEIMDPETQIDLDKCSMTLKNKSSKYSITYPGETFEILTQTTHGYKIKKPINFGDFAGITTDKTIFTAESNNNIIFQLNLIDPNIAKINDAMVWTPASGIDVKSFEFHIDGILVNHPINNNKPLIKLDPIEPGIHEISISIADNVGRKSFMEFNINVVYATNIEKSDVIPTEFSLEQSYPNPFNPTTTINYSLVKDSYVLLTIYDCVGNIVENIVNNQKPAGYHKINWDASAQPSGVYFYKLTTSNFSDIKKCILLK